MLINQLPDQAPPAARSQLRLQFYQQVQQNIVVQTNTLATDVMFEIQGLLSNVYLVKL